MNINPLSKWWPRLVLVLLIDLCVDRPSAMESGPLNNVVRAREPITGIAPGSVAIGGSFRIVSLRSVGNSAWKLTHESDTNSYYILFRGGAVTNINVALALHFGTAGSNSFNLANEPKAAAFYLVRRVSLGGPIDADQDGIDDVYELNHPTLLNALVAADARQDPDGDGYSNLEEYQAGTDPGVPEIPETVYVVDDPPVGSTVHFRELTNAVAYLESHLPAARPGKVVIATARQMSAGEILFTFDLTIQADPGFIGRVVLNGPGVAPLMIRGGAATLSGLAIVNSGGLVIQTGRKLQLLANSLPATRVEIGSAGSSLRRAASGRLIAAASVSEGGEIQRNSIIGSLDLKFARDLSSEAIWNVTDNTMTTLSVINQAKFNGQLNLKANVASLVDLSLGIVGEAKASVEMKANVDQFNLNCTTDEELNFQLQNTVVANLSADIRGVGRAFLEFGGGSAKTASMNLGAGETTVTSRNQSYDRLAATLLSSSGTALQRLTWEEENSHFNTGFEFKALQTEDAEVNMRFRVTDFKRFEIDTAAKLGLDLGENVRIDGECVLGVRQGLTSFNASQARFGLGMKLNVYGVDAELAAYFKGGTMDGDFAAGISEGAVAVTIDIADLIFGTASDIRIVRGPQISPLPTSGAPSLSKTTARRHRSLSAASGVILHDLPSGPPLVLITDFDLPVTIENCTFHGTSMGVPEVILQDVKGPVIMRNNNVTGTGLAANGIEEEVVIQKNRIEASLPGAGAISVLSSAHVTIADNTIAGSGEATGGIVLAVPGQAAVTGNVINSVVAFSCTEGEITLEGNTLNGITSIAGGRVLARKNTFGQSIVIIDGVLGMDSNSIAASIADLNPNGGLINDPVPQGVNPEDVYSSVDFDNDPLHCADYPPPQYNDNGQCVRAGIPPPR